MTLPAQPVKVVNGGDMQDGCSSLVFMVLLMLILFQSCDAARTLRRIEQRLPAVPAADSTPERP